jgi:hypothetical protein
MPVADTSSDFPVADAVKMLFCWLVAWNAPLASCLNVKVPVVTSVPSTTPHQLTGFGPSTKDS